MDYSVKVKKLRNTLSLSQEDFAHEIGVSFATVNRWETGKSKPSKLAERVIDLYCDKLYLSESKSRE